MSGWRQLEHSVSKWLSTFTSAFDLKFCNAHQAIPGFPSNGFRSDGLLTNGQVLLAVEIEAGQMHPDTNVGKYWLLYEYKHYQKIVLFHVYTPDFNSYDWRRKLGEFYAKKMQFEIPIDYVLLDYRKAKDFNATLAEIKAKIGARVKQEFEVVSAS